MDYSQGDIKETGNPLDYRAGTVTASSRSKDRAERSTRATASSKSTTKAFSRPWTAFPLHGKTLSGAIDTAGTPIIVNAEGVVRQNDRELGRLKLMNFTDHQQLQSVDGGYFERPLELEETAHTAILRQGSLEGSNVSPIEEMIAMIGVQRRFSGASNVLSMINETYRRLTRLQ